MKLFFDSLKIESFMSVDSIELDLSNRGLTLVRGINNYEPKFESNGSGKSSIFDSIIWCLLGSTTRDVNRVSNENSESGARVELKMRINSDNFCIIRTEDPKTLQIYQNGEDISGNTYTKSQSILNEKLGWIGYDALISIVILSQGLPGRFTSLKPKDRKVRLEYLSGIDGDLEVLINRVSRIYSELSNKRNTLTHRLSEITGSIATQRQSIATASSKIEELVQIQPISEDEYVQLKSEYEDRNRQYEISQKDLLTQNSELTQLNQRFYKLESESNMNERYLQDCKNQLLQYLDSKCPTCGAEMDCTDKIEECQKKILDLTDQIEKSRENAGIVKVNITNLTNIIKSTQNRSQSFLDGQQERLQKLRDYEVTRSSIDAYQSTIVEATERIDTLMVEDTDLKDKLLILDKKIEITNFYKSNLSKKFRSYLLEEVVNYLNSILKKLSGFLYEVQGSVRLEIDGNDIKIYLGDREFGALSGGEGRRVDLILQLAQRQLCEVQSGFSCNLLVIDEILDYLDAVGVDNVLSLLEMNSTSVETLMLVTHRPDLNITFDTVLTVMKDKDQMSRLVWR